ncbi:MAG: hypothetical protein KAT15_23515, partial [Bacteroidales bacterium]|nr:hypothetical protein [Bacteroidales bacterium]
MFNFKDMKSKYNNIFLISVIFLMMGSSLSVFGQSCEDLISYWRFEESSGSVYTDHIGGHDAVAI